MVRTWGRVAKVETMMNAHAQRILPQKVMSVKGNVMWGTTLEREGHYVAHVIACENKFWFPPLAQVASLHIGRVCDLGLMIRVFVHLTCSGGMYSAVPEIVVESYHPDLVIWRAKPKSQILTCAPQTTS